jgi:tRNA dimethylallyltransferase
LSFPVLILGGPTGSGKSQAAIEIASRYPAEIVNADSRQIYRDLVIGTNQPSDIEKQTAPHHLFSFLQPDQSISVADYERRAYPALQEILSRSKLPLITGGTGFYIKAILRGTWAVPAKDPELRDRLKKLETQKGKGHLHKLLHRVDPESSRTVPAADSYRVQRALEIYFQTGMKRSEIPLKEERFSAIKLFLDLPGDELKQRIQKRTELLFEKGWVDEVRELLNRYPEFELMPASASLGYREIIRFLQRKISLENCKDQIFRKTWQYARRQRTWFRNQDQFLSVESSEKLQKIVDSVLQ